MTRKAKAGKGKYGDAVVRKTERSAVAALMHWMREIIEAKGLDLGMPDVDTSGEDRKSPDLVIFESRRSPNALLVMEAKPPDHDVHSEEQLKEPAWQKANQRKARYFAVTNFRTLLWYKTEAVNAQAPESEQLIGKFELSFIENLDRLEDTSTSTRIKRALAEFLTTLCEVKEGRKMEPQLAVDELLISILYNKINQLSNYYRFIISDLYGHDAGFARKVRKWFGEQSWEFKGGEEDFDRTARQMAYLLVNKILFYDLLHAKRPQDLDPLEIPENLTKGAMLQDTLQAYFKQALKIDYETVFTADFIDSIAFPDSKEVVKEIKETIGVLRRYDFSKLGYDVIGRIFEKMIPPEERHHFGQYFTSPDVVDLILRFCVLHEDDHILDPACGAGTFLVRAYRRLKMMNQRQTHEELLEKLWGVDIAKFPAHLATINLAIGDLSEDRNYPNILHQDFFDLGLGAEGLDLENWRKARRATLGFREREAVYPRWFDAIVGNPPYTRQEEMEELGPKDAEYKKALIEKAVSLNGKPLAALTGRSGIHIYFFLHGYKFLIEGGRFGFIVNNSWLDADFGKGLQEFFLDHFKIIAIIESKVERWFAEADVNTCIVILEKCADQQERMKNRARFVYLKKPLAYFIPPAGESWEQEKRRLEGIDELINKTILAHSRPDENDELIINPITQSDLKEKKKRKKPDGSKWGKYLRAPIIYAKLLEKAGKTIRALEEFATVKRGFTTGADPWFYVSDITSSVPAAELKKMAQKRKFKLPLKNLALIESGDGSRWLVEREYLFPVIRNPNQYRKIFIGEAEVPDLVVNARGEKSKFRGKLIEKYLLHGEKVKYNMGKGREAIPARTDTCRARARWYELPDLEPALLFWQKAFDVTHRHYLAEFPLLANQRFYPLYLNNPEQAVFVAAWLNSTLVALYLEFQRSALGLGGLEATVAEVRQVPVLDPGKAPARLRKKIESVFMELMKREVKTIFEELGAEAPEELTLAKVAPDRRELDRLFLVEALGLAEEQQAALYRAVIDLVKHRKARAVSLKNEGSSGEGRAIKRFAKKILAQMDEGS